MSHWIATREEFAAVRGLRDRQIPLDEYELERMQAASLGLEIYEDVDFPSMAFNLPSGGAGYILSAVLSNDSDRPLSPVHIGFEVPDWESGMRLLPDPRKEHASKQFRRRGAYLQHMATRNVYEFPLTTMNGYERDAVLNHRIGPTRRLYRDEPLEGFLMVVGEKPIPWSYRDRERFEIRLTVYDEKGQSSRGRFRVMVERSPKEIELMKKYAKLRESRSHEKLAVAAD